MIVDLVRSCYTTKVKAFTDCDFETEIYWYFCEPGAKPFPEMHRFASLNNASQNLIDTRPGEVLGAPRPWRDGSAPRFALGDHFCGPLEYFVHGQKVTAPPLERTRQDVADCCIRIQTGGGGLLFDGRSIRGKRGGLLFDGSGKVLRSTGGLTFGGARLPLGAGLLLDGGALFIRQRVGGLLFDGKMARSRVSRGGILLDGKKQALLHSEGGVLWDGTRKIVNLHFGGILWGAVPGRHFVSEGGLTFDGTREVGYGQGGLLFDGGLQKLKTAGGLIFDGTRRAARKNEGGLLFDVFKGTPLVSKGGISFDGAAIFNPVIGCAEKLHQLWQASQLFNATGIDDPNIFGLVPQPDADHWRSSGPGNFVHFGLAANAYYLFATNGTDTQNYVFDSVDCSGSIFNVEFHSTGGYLTPAGATQHVYKGP